VRAGTERSDNCLMKFQISRIYFRTTDVIFFYFFILDSNFSKSGFLLNSGQWVTSYIVTQFLIKKLSDYDVSSNLVTNKTIPVTGHGGPF
jgi:hypothetical protein